MLAFRLESAGPELRGRTALEGTEPAQLTGLAKLRLTRVDVCGDQDSCLSLVTSNAIPEAAGLILAPPHLLVGVGSPLRIGSETPC